jgi:hypothetical protein
VVDSSQCGCGWPIENFDHYINHCPLFLPQRTVMKNEIYDLGFGLKNNLIDTQLLLYGNPKLKLERIYKLFDILYRYFTSTKRFNT